MSTIYIGERQSFQQMMLRNLDLNMQKYWILIYHLAQDSTENGLENSTYKACYFETDRGKSRYASTYGYINRCSVYDSSSAGKPTIDRHNLLKP